MMAFLRAVSKSLNQVLATGFFNYGLFKSTAQSSFFSIESIAFWAEEAMAAALAMFSAEPKSWAILEPAAIPSFWSSDALSVTFSMNALISG